jgi:hypothetical protein
LAFLIKNATRTSSSASSRQGLSVVEQYIQVNTAGRTLPSSGNTDQIFRVRGGRVLVKLLVGEVTTVMSGTATNVKVSSKRLSNADVAVGTAVDVGANAAVTSKEVGSFYYVLGSGAASIVNNAGAGLATLGVNPFILPQGEVYITTDATNTGAMKWDIFYLPLDPGAYVESVVVATAAI